jgi:hypothetical protein
LNWPIRLIAVEPITAPSARRTAPPATITSMRGWRYKSIATLRLLVMTSRSSCEVSALATSSVVVPMLMNSEQPFGIREAAASPIARFSLCRDEASRLIGEVFDAGGDDGAAMDARQRALVAEVVEILADGLRRNLETLGEILHHHPPKARAMLRISVWRWDSPATAGTLAYQLGHKVAFMVRLIGAGVNEVNRRQRRLAGQQTNPG